MGSGASKTTTPPPSPPTVAKRTAVTESTCPQQICIQYWKSLNLNQMYFNKKFNKCFCSECYNSSKPSVIKAANSSYTIPRDWVSFAIQVDVAFAKTNHIFKTWYTTFYGTSKDKIDEIIHNRFIPFPGDELLSGKKFVLTLSDQHNIYTSPSINYASLEHICPKDRAKINDQWYNFQVVLQCKQNPADIRRTPSGKPNVCSLLPNDTLQWKTDQRSSVVPYALLIRATKC